MKPAPVVVLARPQMGENIGAVARAMSNFGLSELRIVAPRDGWPNPKAWEMASGGKSIIEAAQVFPDFVSAMHDIQLAYATTARPRDMEKRVVTPSEAMSEIRHYCSPPLEGGVGGGVLFPATNSQPLITDTPPTLPWPLTRAQPSRGEGLRRIALVFGPERTGLENEEITWCDAIITIPTAPENFSLNLGQSAVVLGYEWWKQSVECRVLSAELKENASTTVHSALGTEHSPASKSHWDGLFTQLEAYLDEADFFRVAEKKPVMWQNLRTSLIRAQMSEQEIQTLRGVFRVLYEGRKRR